jgi:hypothetical protein
METRSPEIASSEAMHIRLSPTWTACMKMLLAVLESGTSTGKQLARDELMDLAARLDRPITPAFIDLAGNEKPADSEHCVVRHKTGRSAYGKVIDGAFFEYDPRSDRYTVMHEWSTIESWYPVPHL